MTDAELAILSIIAEGPIYGYDLQTVITQRGLRAWTIIGVSSMYYVVENLERQVDRRPGQSAGRWPDPPPVSDHPGGLRRAATAVADLLSTPREHANGLS